jgi:hypothetical protein
MLPILLIVTFMYVLVGLVLLRYQEKWYEENQPSFIKNLSPFDYLRHVFKIVFWWLPNLIFKRKFKKIDVKENKKTWWEKNICDKVPDDLDI